MEEKKIKGKQKVKNVKKKEPNKMKNEQKKHNGKIIISISNRDAQMPSQVSVASQGPE